MKIAMVNNQWQLGGAETVMHQLHDGLRAAGHESRIHVAEGKNYPAEAVPLYPRMLSWLDHSRYHELANRWFPRFERMDRNFRKLASDRADVIHLHNFHGNYASIDSLAYVGARKKFVWTFHALWGVTGGCDHPRDCRRYQEQCGSCPQVGQWAVGPEDHTAEELQEKLTRISDLPMHIVAPSRWLADIVSGSQVGKGWDVRTIYNGVDPSQFRGAKRGSERVSVLVINQKGISMVREALSMVPADKLDVIFIGQGTERGYVKDRTEMARLYAETDIFLFASPAENFPCVVLEAMASECCVVATPTGGVVEQIEHGRSGLLAEEISGDALGRMLRCAVEGRELRRELGKAARERVAGNFTEEQMVRGYIELYRELINES